jgi:hypothetical protein
MSATGWVRMCEAIASATSRVGTSAPTFPTPDTAPTTAQLERPNAASDTSDTTSARRSAAASRAILFAAS